jgi:Flp pilus assembly protein TadG
MIEWREDRGASGTIEMVLAIGLIMFPIVMLVAAIPTWIETKSMAELAAQEAARAVVLADAQEVGEATGTAIARQIADNHGLDGSILSVSYDGVLDWGATITADVTIPVPVLAIPGIGTFASGNLTVSHSERVDDYRSFAP